LATELKDLFLDHADTFATGTTDIGYCNLLQHDIDTQDTFPTKQSPHRPPLSGCQAEADIMDEMLESGVIEPSDCPWTSPVCIVKKKDGTFRFYVDYIRVNSLSRRDAFPIPDIHDALEHLRGSRYFATIDLLSGYWQLGMTDRPKERSAFCTGRGLFQFTQMPFGLAAAPASFCRLMSQVFIDRLSTICVSYLNDIIVFAITPEELLECLRIILDILCKVGLKVRPSNCVLLSSWVILYWSKE